MRFAVTGATGFIGHHVARQLLLKGHEVAALVRATSGAAGLEDAGAELYLGDVLDPASLRRPLRDADRLVHLAAPRRPVGPFQHEGAARVLHEGTRNVLSTMREMQIPHGALVTCLDGHPDGPQRPSPLGALRLEAHGKVVEPQLRIGLPISLAVPDVVYGPGDSGPVGRMLARLAKGPGTVPAGGGHGWVHVQDAAAGIALCAASGRDGETYHLSGPMHTVREVAQLAAARLGVKGPHGVPIAVAGGVSRFLGPLRRLLPGSDVLDAELVRLASTSCIASDAKARAEFGWAPRDLAEGLTQTFAAVLQATVEAKKASNDA